ncbi:RIP metalloprotease RseP [Amphibiibacter pelophylacis]|uniref:RIP metalloprotease RseP n=1 Tax=Amphibiibacter pelophylacis TaxID=1799477 RepID=A0ACC6NYS5_9BURK
MMLTTLLAFLFTLGVLVVVHEYGHYRAALACGVRVLRFSVGFGPVIARLKRQRGPDTIEYVISALPLGGYVRMLDSREGEVAPEERERAFNHRPLRQRAIIVAAGPLANFALAVLLYAGAAWIGQNEALPVVSAPSSSSVAFHAGLRAGDRVVSASSTSDSIDDATPIDTFTDLRWRFSQASLSQEPLWLNVLRPGSTQTRQIQIPPTPGSSDVSTAWLADQGLGRPWAEPRVEEVEPGSVADEAGLQAGDLVLATHGEAVPDAATLVRRIADHAAAGGAPMQWRVLRDGRELDLSLQPRFDEDTGRARVGVVLPAPAMALVRQDLLGGLSQGLERTRDVSVMTLTMLGRILTGEASVRNISGPVTIADYAGRSVMIGAAAFLGFMAMVSVSLGVMNLLPLPMLDGGHLVYYAYEAVAGRPVSDAWQQRLQKAGASVLLLMMAVALFNDVSRLMGA